MTVTLALVACGDNLLPEGPPLVAADQLTVVAHEDDDLLFMQPLVDNAVRAGMGVTTVYVTAGNGRRDYQWSESRYAGLREAYAWIAGDRDWECGWIWIAGFAAQHCRLDAAKLSLVFLGYPDGRPDGSASQSLLHLWQGDIATATTVAERSSTYTRTGVVDALREIIEVTGPTTVRTLEVASNHGRDHSDHMMVGALALLGVAASHTSPDLVSYRGYNIEDEAPNSDPALYARALDAIAYYEACTAHCASCGAPCPVAAIDRDHVEYLHHHYGIGMRRTGAGVLKLDDRCLGASPDGGTATLVDCAAAPGWTIESSGALRADTGGCLTVGASGEVVTGPCGLSSPNTRFFLDDEGHLWSGLPPLPQAGMQKAHLDCVAAVDGQPRAVLCGDGKAPTWQLQQIMSVTPRKSVGITRRGRSVRLARLGAAQQPALCAIEPARGLLCAQLAADGSIAPMARLDAAEAPLEIDPESLVFGDVDGDGRADACGRSSAGIVCAMAASGYRAHAWGSATATSGSASPSDQSLGIVAGRLCGLANAGVICLGRGQDPTIRSTWPKAGGALWIGDLDGDGAPDWCAGTASGPACNVASLTALTTSGIPWGYARDGVVEGSAAAGPALDTAIAALTDIDGDGRDDLCSLAGGSISCARSLGHGFAPQAAIARLPSGMTPTSLWVERRARGTPPRLCVADDAMIACTH